VGRVQDQGGVEFGKGRAVALQYEQGELLVQVPRWREGDSVDGEVGLDAAGDLAYGGNVNCLQRDLESLIQVLPEGRLELVLGGGGGVGVGEVEV